MSKYTNREKVIKFILENKTLYIKNTGVPVEVTYFGTDSFFGSHRSSQLPLCAIEVQPSKGSLKAIKLMHKYHIKKNSHDKKIELEGYISIDNLSTIPFENKTSKILFKK